MENVPRIKLALRLVKRTGDSIRESIPADIQQSRWPALENKRVSVQNMVCIIASSKMCNLAFGLNSGLSGALELPDQKTTILQNLKNCNRFLLSVSKYVPL